MNSFSLSERKLARTIRAVGNTFELAVGDEGELVSVMVPESAFRKGRNRVQVNRQPLLRTRDLLGSLRVSVFSPDGVCTGSLLLYGCAQKDSEPTITPPCRPVGSERELAATAGRTLE